MKNIVGVQFKQTGKVYFFDPGELNINNNDYVIVETSQGDEYGKVVVKKVLRIATQKDIKHYEENKAKEKDAMEI